MTDTTQNDPWVVYLIVRESLGMSIGKTAAQAGHAVEYICRECLGTTDADKEWERQATFKSWTTEGNSRKVVLRADEKEWVKLKEEFKDNCVIVIDFGFTELAPHTETVIGLFPLLKSQAPKLIKRLQALK